MAEAEVYNIIFPSNQADLGYMEAGGFESSDKGEDAILCLDSVRTGFISAIYTGATKEQVLGV